jgi:hypothetical protein
MHERHDAGVVGADAESAGGPFNAPGDRNIAGAIDAVKNEGETAALFGLPIDVGLAEEPQCFQEVGGFGLVDALCAEVVDNEGESEGSCAVCPETRRDGHRGMTARCKEFD